MVAQMWPQLVMEWNNDFLPACKENLVNTTLQSHCRDQDGQVDGVFDPRNCDVLTVLRRLIGTLTPCGTFTASRCAHGPGDLAGTAPFGLAAEPADRPPRMVRARAGREPGRSLRPGPGTRRRARARHHASELAQRPMAGAPFIPSADWFQNWIKQDPSWVFTEETYQQYWQDFAKSGQMFDAEIAAENPDLQAFKAAGGKLIMWQGLADQLIFTGDSINYYNRALAANGGIRNTESFFRYFLAPGVGHCGAPGPGSIAPANPMQQVINWVENGQAPAVLDASGTINGQAVTRPLCPYPDADATYTGGNPNAAASYTCRSQPHFTNPFLLNGQHGHRAERAARHAMPRRGMSKKSMQLAF